MFIGDIGTLSIGAVIACAVIIGNFETAGAIVIIPYAIDFIIKAKNRFPSSDWWGTYADGKLTCPKKPVGLCQTIMKLTGGISEKNLVLSLIGLELIFGVIAVLIYGI
jgi:UDP-N-acetylglucosamine--dolichyl-phosphate N-acetylglucosaminephosphotransferase